MSPDSTSGLNFLPVAWQQRGAMQSEAVYTRTSVMAREECLNVALRRHHLAWNTACSSGPNISGKSYQRGRTQSRVENVDGGRKKKKTSKRGWLWLKRTGKHLWNWGRASRKEREGLFGVLKSGITAVMRWNWAKENLGLTLRRSLLTASLLDCQMTSQGKMSELHCLGHLKPEQTKAFKKTLWGASLPWQGRDKMTYQRLFLGSNFCDI